MIKINTKIHSFDNPPPDDNWAQNYYSEAAKFSESDSQERMREDAILNRLKNCSFNPKHFDLCPKKTYARYWGVSKPVLNIGGLKKEQVIVSLSGLMSAKEKATEAFQFYSAGILSRDYSQYIGSDTNKDYCELNSFNYGIKNHNKDILNVLQIQGIDAQTKFINLDTQACFTSQYKILGGVLNIMRDFNNFGVCFNTILETAWSQKFSKSDPKEKWIHWFWEEAQKRDSWFAQSLKGCEVVDCFWYMGTGKSNTTMVSYVLRKP